MDIISIAVTLILIMDPFGNIPVFLSILDELPAHRRRRILVRELILALVVIMVFIFCGRYLMGFLGLKQEAVSIAGGIILFLIAIRMVFPRTKLQDTTECEGEPLLVPLAIPLIAGPSLLAVLILFSTSAQVELSGLLLASMLAWGVSFIVLFSATFLIRFLTRRGLIAVERLMGMILVAIAVQLFLDGVASYLG
jgi:multiple antibiotic resistance protein